MGEGSKNSETSSTDNGIESDSSDVLDLTDGSGADEIEISSTDVTPAATSASRATSKGGGAGRRLAGILAAILGLVGCVLSFVVLAASLRLGFAADDVARDTAAPLVEAVDRLETRIDQADDLVDREGVSGPEFRELQARADGLADTASAATSAFSSIDDHALYRWLPIDKSELSDSLASLAEGSAESASAVDGVQSLSAAQAVRVGERVNTMQDRVSSVGDLIDNTVDSLISWIRLASLGGFFLSLWSLWSQVSLMKRGWRGLRGQQP